MIKANSQGQKTSAFDSVSVAQLILSSIFAATLLGVCENWILVMAMDMDICTFCACCYCATVKIYHNFY